MSKPQSVILCACSLGNPPFDQLVAIAARQAVAGLSLWQPYLMEQQAAGWSLSAMRELLDESGVNVAMVEACSRWSEPCGFDAQARAEADAVAASALALGAPLVLAVNLAAPAALDAMSRAFRELCEVLDRQGLRCAVEFMPWTGVPDLASARVLLDAASAFRPQVMVDSWHVFRGSTALEEIAALPEDAIAAVQLNDFRGDAEADSNFEETMTQRCLPGEGWFDLPALLRAVRASGSSAPLAVELIHMDGGAGLAEQRAERAQAALDVLLAQCG